MIRKTRAKYGIFYFKLCLLKQVIDSKYGILLFNPKIVLNI